MIKTPSNDIDGPKIQTTYGKRRILNLKSRRVVSRTPPATFAS